MDPQSALLFGLVGIVLPFMLSLLATGAVWWRASGIEPGFAQPRHRLRRLASATLAPALILLLVQSLMLGVPTFPPREAMHRLPFLLLAGLLFGAIELAWMSSSWKSTLIGAMVLAAAAGIASLASAWLVLAVVIAAGAWIILRQIAWRETTPTILIPLGLYAAGTAAVLVATGNLKLAQLAAACAMSLLAILAVALARPKLTLAGPALTVTLAWLGALLGQGMTYGDTPKTAGLLWGIGGPIVICVMHHLLRKRAFARGWIAPALGAIAVLVLAVAIAMLSRGEPLPAYGG
jgi:hypothetical protein